jgi:membrane-bound ClpP family serine protease
LYWGGPPAPASVPAYRQANTVAVLVIHGPIDKVTLSSLDRRVKRAIQEGAEAVVLDIDTPGGALEATLDICHLVRNDAPANTVAWVNPKAYSAGTIIALACREIVVSPDSAFGDAAPISPFGPIPVTERAKLESPILSEVIDSARRNHYDEKLVQAFVSVGVELWLIENKKTGERIFVDRREYEMVMGDEAPSELTRVAPPPQPATSTPVSPWFDTSLPPTQIEEPDPDDRETLQRQIELEQDRPSSRRVLTEGDRGQWKSLRQVVSNDRLLVLKPSEASYYGLSAAIIANDEQLKAYFGAQTVVRYDQAWSESLVQFLTNPIVRGVLLVIFVITLLIELAAPGLGVFGATAGVALLVVIGAPWLTGMAQWWEIVLIAVGLGLIAVELFVIPGFGIAGVSGAGCVLVGLIGTFVSDDLSSPAGQSDLLQGLTATLAALFAAGVAAWFLFRQIETLPLLGRFILKTELPPAVPGTSSVPGLLEAIGSPRLPLQAGDTGIAETDLRPSGRADFDGRLVDVKSIGAYIERGARLRVTAVGPFGIEVEDASE